MVSGMHIHYHTSVFVFYGFLTKSQKDEYTFYIETIENCSYTGHSRILELGSMCFLKCNDTGYPPKLFPFCFVDILASYMQGQ